MKRLSHKYLDVLEKRDWKVRMYSEDGTVELEWWSPAGEDIVLDIPVKDFPWEMYRYYQDFDVDEHVEMWVEARFSGVKGIPQITRLVLDAEKIDKELENLVYELLNVYWKGRYSTSSK